MAVRLRKGNALASLSMTPLIDVVFLLNIFFLVATRFAEEDQELDVLLPAAAEAKPLTVKPKLLYVNIDQQGRYYFDGAVLPLSQLKLSLARAAVNNPISPAVVLRADQRCEWGFVAAALEACYAAGIKVSPATSTQRTSPTAKPSPS
jgi:biopolymer transport protein ExbD